MWFKKTPEQLRQKYPELFEYWWKQGYEAGFRAIKRENARTKEENDKIVKMQPQTEKQLRGELKSLRDSFNEYRKNHRHCGKNEKLKRNQYYQNKYFPNKKLEKDPNFCIYCGADADTFDHMTPKSRGGSDKPENIVPACYGCNLEKGNMTYEEYQTWRRYHKPD